MANSLAQRLPDSFQSLAAYWVSNDYGSRKIICRTLQDESGPGVFVIPGFGRDIWEPKADFLYGKCQTHKHNFVAFSYSGMDGPGRIVSDFSLVRWVDDPRMIFENIAEGPQIVVASSFGATVALQLASDYPERVRGLVLIGPGTDLQEHMLHPLLFNDKRRADYEKNGYFSYPISHPSGTKLIKITRDDITGGQEREVFRDREDVVVNCPVTIIHDMKDTHIPYAASHQLRSKIKAPSRPRIIGILGGCHELNQRRADLDIIWAHTKILLDQAGPR